MENNMIHETKTIDNSTLIRYLNLPDRVISSLRKNGIDTIGDLIQYSPDAIVQFPQIGPSAMKCLEEELGRYGYRLQSGQQEGNADSLALNINCLGLTAQKVRMLRSYGINTIGDFQKITRTKLREMPSFGKKIAQIIEEKIKGYGVMFQDEIKENILEVKISDSALPCRAKRVLEENGIKTLGEFLSMPREEFVVLEGASVETFSSAMVVMAEYGYDLRTGQPSGDTNILTWKVETLGVQRKAITKLNAAGITTIKQLVELTQAEIEGISGIGITLSQEIIKALKERGLDLKEGAIKARTEETTQLGAVFSKKGSLQAQELELAAKVRKAQQLYSTLDYAQERKR